MVTANGVKKMIIPNFSGGNISSTCVLAARMLRIILFRTYVLSAHNNCGSREKVVNLRLKKIREPFASRLASD